MIYLLNKDQRDALFFLIYQNNLFSRCFEWNNYSPSGGSLLYMQHMVFVMYLR